ncbi:MAG TPA: biotin--[acetyl-CoA-carboxylase] ligase [Nocardioides sp.]|uniref:biotin--[acetyl-CoA-carboxylase] ligase n=1 Tax=uncultured Nocardioides sp. TaxID=198441 RepID=UPI002612CD39|nr:biotin--[acetyl-CoA-carboxylase] ligase [uncultured Nocardioides sp.]HRI95246.1 biotin--[acetyl-CoA-carboxylase] ligase [Nocardioides sp.]
MDTDPAPRPPDRPALDPGRLPDHQVEVVEAAASTNALVTDQARQGGPEGLVILAEHQTAGRGRLDRSWETPPRSGLTFSVLLRPTMAPAAWPWLPLLAGYSVCSVLREAGFDATVKWPNDVLIEDRKVAGILVERVETPDGPAAIVGIGINVGMTAEELPVPEATSLAVVGEAPDRTELLGLVLDRLWGEYVAWRAGGQVAADRLATAYAEACSTIGSQVRVQLPAAEELTGTATGVDVSGRLLVRHADGTTAVSAGDVVHVRAAE